MYVFKELGVGVTTCGKVMLMRTKKFLSQWVDCTGYYQIVFRVDGKKKYIRVHRLIAKAYLEDIKGKPQVNHIDGNKLNNSICNLEYASNSENTQHGYDNNLYYSKKRSYPVFAIDKETKERLEFSSIRSMCECLGVNRKTVSNILSGVKKTNNYKYDFEYGL